MFVLSASSPLAKYVIAETQQLLAHHGQIHLSGCVPLPVDARD